MVYTQGYIGLPLDMQSHGLGPGPYGTAIGVNGFLIILMTIPISNMAAKWPRFETVAAAALLIGLGFGATILANSFAWFVLSVAIWTFGEIAGTSVSPTIIADLSPIELRGLYQGIFGAAWGLAYFLGPLVGGWVYQNLGSDVLWFGCLVIGIMLAFGFYALRAPAKRQRTESQSLSTD